MIRAFRISTIKRTRRANLSLYSCREQRRNFSAKDSSSKQQHPPKNVAPEIKIDPNSGNTILHQKAARAAELHAELNALLDKQAKRRAEEMNRSFISGFADFVKKSKSEIINIFAAFTCVLLAWQISNIRKGARKLLEDAGEKEVRMEKLKQILRVISNDTFTDRVVNAYEEQLEKSKLLELEKKGKGWILGRNNNSDDDANQEKESTLLKSVIKNELSKMIGDQALTEFEIEEKKLKSLQKEMGIVDKNNVDANDEAMRRKQEEDSLGGLEKILVESQKSSNVDEKVVKRKGFI